MPNDHGMFLRPSHCSSGWIECYLQYAHSSVCSLILVTLLEPHDRVAYKQQISFSQFWGLGSLRSRPWQFQCLIRASFLLTDSLAMSSHSGRWGKSLRVLSQRDKSHSWWPNATTLEINFNTWILGENRYWGYCTFFPTLKLLSSSICFSLNI